MALFQKSVLKEYLALQDASVVDKQWNKFQLHFHHPQIQANIRKNKEEQYQGEFLQDLFANILGYIKNPQPDFNITTEHRNIKDAKKADGAIIIDNKVYAVIELKGTATTDLGKIEIQAFGYKNNQLECTYVITSNYEKLRFYVDNAIEHLEFNLFTLSKEEFELLYLCMSYENLRRHIPKKLKDDSISEEEAITKKLYKDYSLFKRELHRNLVSLNPTYDPLELFTKSQKLLDRFLFLFFAEDRQLLARHSVRTILSEWRYLQDLDVDITLYQRFKNYFEYLNSGYKGKRFDVFAYNGGLFKTDQILDKILIDDELLYEHSLKLSKYDFGSEVDVNILGHIFENSLNELEEIKAQLEGKAVDKKTSKRKKDGVFYTPKYITKYIVASTIGKLSTERKSLLEIHEDLIDDSFYTKTRTLSKEGKDFVKRLNDYRAWLLDLKICDPACGSGAFLNQAFEFLIAEHSYVDSLVLKIQTLQHGTFNQLSTSNRDISNEILENNLFGVDLNEESVEIAKLSLWLRTAQPYRKLNDLSNNIKCGNSLINNLNISTKGFNWEAAFPKVFAKGGFDVIIGNPPYVNANDIKKYTSPLEFSFLKSNYSTAKGTVDLYIYFFEKGLRLINKNGILSYITPNRFLSASYGTALRKFIVSEYKLDAVIDYSDKRVFPDASTYPVITTISNKSEPQYEILTGKFDDISKQLIAKNFPSTKLDLLDDYILGFLLNDKLEITEKIISKCIPLDNAGKINATSTAKEADDFSALINEDDGYKLVNTGTIDPYISTWGHDFFTDKGVKFKTPYLPKNNNIISKNRHSLYSSPKIIISKIGLRCEAFYDKQGIYASVNTNCIHTFHSNFKAEYVLCWLNSKVYNYMFECLFDGLRMSGGYLLFSAPNLKNTQIYEATSTEQKFFVTNAELLMHLKSELQSLKAKFERTIHRQFKLSTLSKKLREWHKYPYSTFTSELKKLNIETTLKSEADWEEYFVEELRAVTILANKIHNVEKLIDSKFYKLLKLNEEEITIIENNFTTQR